MIDLKENLIENNFKLNNNVYRKTHSNDGYVVNFSEQWKDFSKTQIDEFNNTEISKNLLDKVIFSEFENIQDKKILGGRLWIWTFHPIFIKICKVTCGK